MLVLDALHGRAQHGEDAGQNAVTHHLNVVFGVLRRRSHVKAASAHKRAAAAYLAEHGARVEQKQLVLQVLRTEQLDKPRHGALRYNLAARFNVPARATRA